MRLVDAMIKKLLDFFDGDEQPVDGHFVEMTLDGYQKAAGHTAVYDASKGPAIVYATGKLACEGGEAHQVVLKKAYHDSPADDAEADRRLKKELGDVLWYLSESCRVKGWKLSEVAAENLDKLSGRQDRGTLTGSGDDR